MVATVRCEEIADEKLKSFISDKVACSHCCIYTLFYLIGTMRISYSSLQGWLELETAANSGLVPGFGKKLNAILDFYLSE